IHGPLPARTAARGAGDLGEDVRLARVEDGVHRVESEAVEMIFLQPVERVVDEKVAYRAAPRALEVHGRAPGSRVPSGEELRRVQMKEVALGPEVVVDHVEHHCDAVGVCRAYQRLE